MTQQVLDEKVLECALRLHHSPEFVPFITWLKQRREDVRNRLEAGNAPDAAMHQQQGRGQELREILQFIEMAGPNLGALRGKQK